MRKSRKANGPYREFPVGERGKEWYSEYISELHTKRPYAK